MQSNQKLGFALDSVLIRAYETSDYEALAGIYLHSRKQNFYWQEPDTFATSDFDVVLNDDQIWIATYEALPLGYVSLLMADHFLHHLFVDPLYQGCGIGKQLLQHVQSLLKQGIYLKCLCTNHRAQAFYLKQGFTILSRGTDSDGDYYLMGFDIKQTF